MLSKSKFSLNTAHVEAEDSEGTWAVSYGDLITLLLCFFVIFFSTDPAREKIEKMNHFLGFQIEGLRSVVEDLKKEIVVESKADSLEIKDFKNLDIAADKVGDSLVISFGPVSFFNSGQSDLRPSSKKVLDAFLEQYMNYAGSYILSIKGFTDKNPIRKSRFRFKDNLELSAMRSLSAMRYFRGKGIPFKRMEIAGQGELESISTVLKQTKNLTKQELDAISRTLVLVIKPDLGVKQ